MSLLSFSRSPQITSRIVPSGDATSSTTTFFTRSSQRTLSPPFRHTTFGLLAVVIDVNVSWNFNGFVTVQRLWLSLQNIMLPKRLSLQYRCRPPTLIILFIIVVSSIDFFHPLWYTTNGQLLCGASTAMCRHGGTSVFVG